MRFLVRVLLNALAIGVAAWIVPGVQLSGPGPAVIAGILLGEAVFGLWTWREAHRWRREALRGLAAHTEAPAVEQFEPVEGDR